MTDNKNYPTVSVIIPSYNGSKLILNAIQSVLDTGYPNLEIVVIDDGSEDNSVQVIRDYIEKSPNTGIRLLTHSGGKHKGTARTRNFGIKNSSGKYICFLDQDDTYLKNRFQICIPLLESNPQLNAVCEFALCELFGYKDPERLEEVKKTFDTHLKATETARRNYVESKNKNLFSALLEGTSGIHPSTMTLHKSVLKQTGLFPAIQFAEDRGLWLKILSLNQAVYGQTEPVALHIRHENSTVSKNEKKAALEFSPIKSSIHTYFWMKHSHIAKVYVEQIKADIMGRFYFYSSIVLRLRHSFFKDVIWAMIQVAFTVPKILFEIRFWKVGLRLLALKIGLIREQ